MAPPLIDKIGGSLIAGMLGRKTGISSVSASGLAPEPPEPTPILILAADLGVTPNGSTASAWADQSGNGNNYSQATGASQPLIIGADALMGGRQTLSSPAASVRSMACVNGTFAGTLAFPFTLYCAGYSTVASVNAGMWIQAAGGQCRGFIGNSDTQVSARISATPLVLSALFSGANAHLYCLVVQNAANCDLYVDSSVTPAASGTPPSMAIPTSFGILGADGNAGFTMGAFEVYNGAHNGTVRGALFTYQGAKWGQAWA